MNVLDLFSGIGGFSLGLERTGMRTAAFCETEPYCRAVLAKHWPDVPVYGDIRALTAVRLAADGIIRPVPNTALDRRRPGRPWRSHPSGARQQQSAFSGIDLICGGFPCQDISAAGKGAGIDGARSGLWSRFKEDQELCGLLSAVYAKSFEESQDLLSGVLERIGQKQRPKALGSRVDRLRALGNAIVPQIAEIIGRELMVHEAARRPDHAA